jgi:hypothetical protein
MEVAEVGSSAGLENQGVLRDNSSMLSTSLKGII